MVKILGSGDHAPLGTVIDNIKIGGLHVEKVLLFIITGAFDNGVNIAIRGAKPAVTTQSGGNGQGKRPCSKVGWWLDGGDSPDVRDTTADE